MNTSLWKDVGKSCKMFNVALYLAYGDARARYKRSFFGAFWIVLSTFISVIGLGIVWGAVFNIPTKDIIPSLTLGLVFWQYISSCITDSPSIFIRNATSIKSHPNPYMLFIFHHILKHLTVLLHNAVLIILVCLFFGISKSINNYLIFGLGMILVTANLTWISASLAIISTRFRDIELIVVSLMPVMFFVTPVIFKPNQIESIKYLMHLNPFASFISVLRDPLYYDNLNYTPFMICFLMFVIGSFITALIYKRMIREVPYLL